tara:strand:+ start:1716 stop:3803 length:2088 start_codon:yes stop_codon:yes gene_type:complete
MNNTSSYSKWVAKQPVVEKMNGTHEFVLPTLRDNILTEQSKVSTPRARLMVSQERVEAENAFDDIVFEYDAKERKEEKSYIVSLRAQRELASYEAGDMSPVNRERADLLSQVKLIADREECPITEIKRPEAVCEATEYLTRPFLDQKEHERLEREGGLDDELLNADVTELNWVDVEDAANLDVWNEIEAQRRTDEWRKLQSDLNEREMLVTVTVNKQGFAESESLVIASKADAYKRKAEWERVGYKVKLSQKQGQWSLEAELQDGEVKFTEKHTDFLTARRSINNWKSLGHKVSYTKMDIKPFLVHAVIPELNIKIDQVWTMNKGKRELCTWGQWNMAMVYVYRKILKAQKVAYSAKDSMPKLKGKVKDLLDELGYTLGMNMCDVTRHSRKVESKTLVISLHRMLTEPTRYAEYSKTQNKAILDKAGAGDDVNKFNQFIIRNTEGCEDRSAMSHYDLEKAVMAGSFDTEDLIASTFEYEDGAPSDEVDDELDTSKIETYTWESQQLQKQMGFKRSEVSENLWEYIQFHKNVGRYDIIDESIELEDDQLKLSSELAETIWSGGFNPKTANSIFGTFWNDTKGNLRRGKYLYRTFACLIESDHFNSDVEEAEDKYEEAVVAHARACASEERTAASKKLWGRTKGLMDEARLGITLAKMISHGFEEGHTSYERVSKIMVNSKAANLVWYHGKSAVYGS